MCLCSVSYACLYVLLVLMVHIPALVDLPALQAECVLGRNQANWCMQTLCVSGFAGVVHAASTAHNPDQALTSSSQGTY
jgi:hypothetical protein